MEEKTGDVSSCSNASPGLRINRKLTNVDIVHKLDLSHIRELEQDSDSSLLLEKSHVITSSKSGDPIAPVPKKANGSKLTLSELLNQPSGSESDVLALCERVGRIENWYIEQDSLCLEGKSFAGGSQAKVFRGQVQNLAVCVKQVSKNSRHLKSIARELGILRGMCHPNVVALIGASQSEAGDLQIILEYMSGGDLVSLVRKKLSKKHVVRIALSIARALAYMHGGDKPILHRDLKPENVLVDAMGEAKLADFGLARFKHQSSGKYAMTGVAGTLRYMAPEVIREEAYDEKVDVYALGLTMFYMLTGTPPFKGFDW
eukprot:CAMPEP_0170195968 /NCGR_PEP_ID=MMETSP0040_2-20121228/62711_1 /TAXON_ID=641309 /ORGANISM="Lotharella oceanica, Strain CCMP622" /LENGTH=315 /DNA_ID=CAMNT_0010445269 /DNA_START=221 /DNA_END=1165 /DNA_ORIENTATION=+